MANEKLPIDGDVTQYSNDPIDNIGSNELDAMTTGSVTPEPLEVLSANNAEDGFTKGLDSGTHPGSHFKVYQPKNRGYESFDSVDKGKKRLLIIAGCALACGILATVVALATRAKPHQKETPPQEVVIPKTVAVERADLHSEVSSTGTIQTDSIFAVRGEVAGTVVDVQVSEGQYVYAGTVLLTLTNGELSQAAQDAQTRVDRAERDLVDAQDDLERARDDLKKAKETYDTEYLAYTDALKIYEEAVAAAAYAQPPVAPDPIEVETATDEEKAAYQEAYELYTLEQAAYEKVLENLDEASAPKPPEIFTEELQSKVDSAEKGVASAREALDTAKDELEKATRDDEKRVVKAPVSGTVVSVASPGTQVADPNQPRPADTESPEPLVELSDLDTITVDVTVSEEDIESIARGQLARLSFAEIPDYTCAASVEEIVPADVSAEQDSGDGMRHVTLVVTDADDRILPGMSADVTIVTLNVEQALVVPVNALRMDGDNATVQVLLSEETGEVETRSVALGENDGKLIVVTEGLAEGELVVVPDE